MKVLITGGAGMVGSHCAEHYAKAGHKVLVYDNLMRSKIFSSDAKSVEYNWKYLQKFNNIALIKKDIRSAKPLDQAVKDFKPELVLHAAAQPGVRFSLENPSEDFDINCVGTVNVLEAIRKFVPKATLIYCSTNKVYGDNVNNLSLVERNVKYGFKSSKGVSEKQSIDLTGHTPYGVSKLAGDLYMQDYAYTYGIRTAVFRMSCIYGTRQFGFEDQGWIAWFAIRFLQGKPITVYGDGKQVRDVLWVEDLINAYNKFYQSKLRHGVFNIGGGSVNTLSLLELINILKKVTKTSVDVKFDDWRKFDQKVYISDIGYVCKTLKWAPKVSPKQGVEKIIQWVKDNPKLFNL